MKSINKTHADSDLIRWLLHESGVTRYQIAKETGISQSMLSRVASEIIKLEAIRFGSAHKLSAYAERIQSERVQAEQKLECEQVQAKGALTDGEENS